MAGHLRSILVFYLLSSGFITTYSATGSESVTYTYNDRGRLVRVNRSGTINDGIQAAYTYDKADNRTNVTVTGQTISVADASATEGSPLSFTVTRTGTASAVRVSYATSNGTAAAGSDYVAASGTLNFAIGEVSKPVAVTTTDDAASESAETVTLTLSNPTGGAMLADAAGIGTINDNDAPPACTGVSFTVTSNAAVTEGANSVFTITKSGTATGSCGVSYATANGTATAGSDYASASNTLTFTTGQTSQTVNVTTTDDASVESAETFTLSLSAPTGGAVLGTPNGATAAINDDDGVTCTGVSLAINNASNDEGATLIFTVTKAGTATGSCSVNYATATGTAGTGDFTATSGTLAFASNETTKTISVVSKEDVKTESDETFYVNLSGATGGATISDAQGQGTIFDNDCGTCLMGPPPPEGE